MFVCAQCGYQSIKWLGKCPHCGEWESFREPEPKIRISNRRASREVIPPRPFSEIQQHSYRRIYTGIKEFDQVLGGGFVQGEIVLVGGAPGVGKSTLLLEVAAQFAKKEKTLYVSAEESPEQVALRVERLGKALGNLYVVGEDDLAQIERYVREYEFKFVVIDSVQVVYTPECEGSKGSISQIRGCADHLTRIAKSSGVVICVVGHITKEGSIAGPKLLEHIVDCVLYFEGEALSHYRILRASKNRFGPTGDIALFEMTARGLKEVSKTADLFLPHREEKVSGSSVVCSLEGIRPVFVELQALVSRASFGTVRRRSLGFDFNRFSLLIAIIEKRLKLAFSGEDVFLNVAGGIRLNDPATDLGAAVAIVSSYKERPVSFDTVFIGEIGLAGEVRRVSRINGRLKEAYRGNFRRCFIPEVNTKDLDAPKNLKVVPCATLQDVIHKVFS
ncbi:MAG: DNA repair protein RadA [Candidatus Omnitrophica bacterium]|nr:DNA repair protein RadA [Candidatus Omnitrophota bacterium]